MASGSAGPYSHLDHDEIEQDLIDPDDATLNDLDDPLDNDRAPLTGNIGSSRTGGAPLNQSYLTSSIAGEDRRAPINTIDETVWETVSRDLSGSWEKLRLVLWPKYLLGGMLQRESGAGGLERGEGVGEGGAFAGGIRGVVGRIPDADVILQGSISQGLRDWDLWGPLVFSLLLSLLLSVRSTASDSVFTGVFVLVWVGSVIVTWQIRLLGGSLAFFQTICIIGYTLFPLVIAAFLSVVRLPIIARIPVYIVLVLWSLAAGISILGGSGVVRGKVGLAVYPLFVFYLGLGCLCFIS